MNITPVHVLSSGGDEERSAFRQVIPPENYLWSQVLDAVLKVFLFFGGGGGFLYLSIIFFQLQCWRIWANLYNHWLRPGASGQAEDVAKIDREGETRLEAVLVLLLVNFHN